MIRGSLLGWLTLATMAASVAIPDAPASAQSGAPAAGRDGVILLEPDDAAQPRVTLESDPISGQRRVRLTGEGLSAHWKIDVSCIEGIWSVPRTGLDETREPATAVFDLPREITEIMLRSPRCALDLSGLEVPAPRALLARAWSGASTGGYPPRWLEGRALWVVDGESVGVQIAGRVETVRYIGIRTPLLPAPASGEAAASPAITALNRSLVADRAVRLELDVEERDPVGRLLAYVYVDDAMVNAELVRRGQAEVVATGPNSRHRDLLLALQREAKAERRGLWAALVPDAERVFGPDDAAPPRDSWSCPASHPIKAWTFTYFQNRRLIYYLPASRFSGEIQPERCYATEQTARRDGYRRSRW